MNIKPDFYDEFKCIASDCDFTCCQEWKIAVDDETAAVWKKTTPPDDIKTRRKNLEQFTQYKDGGRVISLENHVCPFLNDEKLCKLVIQKGEAILSEACTVFPREKHEYEDRTEYTLMPCCPAVVDLIESKERFELKCDSMKLDEACACDDKRIEANIRKFIMEIVSNRKLSCEKALLVSFYILLEMYNDDELSVEVAKEAVNQISDAIDDMNFDIKEHFTECNELFLDLTENYIKEGMYEKYLDKLLNGVQTLKTGDFYDAVFEKKWHQFDSLFHKLLAQEVYADLLNADSELYDMVIRMQWIGLEFALIRHMCYLHMKLYDSLEYKNVRDYIVVASRMMGYEEEDIYEYLESSFEEIIWDWGYFALVISK